MRPLALGCKDRSDTVILSREDIVRMTDFRLSEVGTGLEELRRVCCQKSKFRAIRIDLAITLRAVRLHMFVCICALLTSAFK